MQRACFQSFTQDGAQLRDIISSVINAEGQAVAFHTSMRSEQREGYSTKVWGTKNLTSVVADSSWSRVTTSKFGHRKSIPSPLFSVVPASNTQPETFCAAQRGEASAGVDSLRDPKAPSTINNRLSSGLQRQMSWRTSVGGEDNC